MTLLHNKTIKCDRCKGECQLSVMRDKEMEPVAVLSNCCAALVINDMGWQASFDDIRNAGYCLSVEAELHEEKWSC